MQSFRFARSRGTPWRWIAALSAATAVWWLTPTLTSAGSTYPANGCYTFLAIGRELVIIETCRYGIPDIRRVKLREILEMRRPRLQASSSPLDSIELAPAD